MWAGADFCLQYEAVAHIPDRPSTLFHVKRAVWGSPYPALEVLCLKFSHYTELLSS